jgi:hypothetical protein
MVLAASDYALNPRSPERAHCWPRRSTESGSFTHWTILIDAAGDLQLR